MGVLIDRIHRELTAEEIKCQNFRTATMAQWKSKAAKSHAYADEPGFCKSVKLEEIRTHGYVLTPGRYVGAADVEDDGEPFEQKMKRLTADAGRTIRGISEAGESHPAKLKIPEPCLSE